MYDIHLKAESIRAEGLQEIELPFDSLIMAARDSKIMNVRIGTRKDFRNIIRGFFRKLPSDWVMLGLLDPSNRNFLGAGNNTGYLGLSRRQEFSEQSLDDLWLVLRSIFEHHVTRTPGFLKLCTDFINAFEYMQMLKDPPGGHC
ncbi:MAG: hypothetical protein ACLQPD_35200 [Desulfomonilaceae bacterium]